MTEEYVRGSITFDSGHLGPMTTIAPDKWSLLFVSRKRASNAKLTDYEVWNAVSSFVVIGWPWEEGEGYSYPTIKVFDRYDHVERYLNEEAK